MDPLALASRCALAVTFARLALRSKSAPCRRQWLTHRRVHHARRVAPKVVARGIFASPGPRTGSMLRLPRQLHTPPSKVPSRGVATPLRGKLTRRTPAVCTLPTYLAPCESLAAVQLLPPRTSLQAPSLSLLRCQRLPAGPCVHTCSTQACSARARPAQPLFGVHFSAPAFSGGSWPFKATW